MVLTHSSFVKLSIAPLFASVLCPLAFHTIRQLRSTIAATCSRNHCSEGRRTKSRADCIGCGNIPSLSTVARERARIDRYRPQSEVVHSTRAREDNAEIRLFFSHRVHPAAGTSCHKLSSMRKTLTPSKPNWTSIYLSLIHI